jgi:hypothetical protein
MLKWLMGNSGSNSGTVMLWTDTSIASNTKTSCRALVRDDGKILSDINCCDGIQYGILPYGRMMTKPDGRYLVRPGVLYTI